MSVGVLTTIRRRTAETAGASVGILGLLLLRNRWVLTTPVLEYAEVADARADLAAAGFTTYVADPVGATSYRDAGLGSERTAVVVGSESEGVAEEWRTGLTRVSIPMRGRADSLNVATSAAVLLFEARGALDQR